MPETESDPTPLSRIELLRLAQSLGVSDADVMTRAELRAAIEKARAPAPAPIEQPSTWVSVARRLLASVVERGLNLPDAAALIRGDAKLTTPPKAPPPVATVTLARIYAAQGHLDRAIGTLDEVLESDPDHELARDLRAQLELRRQESLARDADAAPSGRPADEELTPIMPEVALREAAERGVAASVVESTARTTSEPAPEPSQPAPASEAVPSTEPPGELVAPAFAVAERAEVPANGTPDEARAVVDVAAHDSQTPPTPSVLSVAAPESGGPTRLAAVEPPVPVEPAAPASLEPAAPASLETSLSSEHDPSGEPGEPNETWAPPGDTTPSDTTPSDALDQAVASAPAPPSDAVRSEPEPAYHAPVANGIENGVAHAPARGFDVLAASAEPPSAAVLAPPAAAAALLPDVPGLLLIEAEQRQYLYWELGSAAVAPCWLHVVSHAPALDGNTERRERRFPVQQRCGALRFEGVPADAVVRAKLSRDPDGRPVAVAGAVRSHDASLEIQFSPHPRAPLEAIARRAEPVLARATPVYWDC